MTNKKYRSSYFVQQVLLYQVCRANVGGDLFVIEEHRTQESAEERVKKLRKEEEEA